MGRIEAYDDNSTDLVGKDGGGGPIKTDTRRFGNIDGSNETRANAGSARSVLASIFGKR